MYLDDAVMKINKILKELEGKQCIVIWGAADNTVNLFVHTDLIKYPIAHIVDKGRAGEYFFGKYVEHPDELCWTEVDAVLISSFNWEKEIYEELIGKYRFIGSVLKLYDISCDEPFYEHISKKGLQTDAEINKIIASNSKFKDIHKGERLFILCTGPSINRMDLKKLCNEYTMAVSGLVYHKDYNYIHPNYYCVPWASDVSDENKMIIYGDADKYITDEQCFFCIQDKRILEEGRYFQGKSVNYHFSYNRKDWEFFDDIDLTLPIMPVQTVPILCLQIAIYMGFQEIYLIGTEHDYLATRKYNHFYENKGTMSECDKSVDANGNIKHTVTEMLRLMNCTWKQYQIIKKIANGKKIKIYNATLGGVLDVFDRVDYDSLNLKI